MLTTILLIIIAWLLWLNYTTVDGFNEDLKQLRILVGHIERYLADNIDLTTPVSPQTKISLAAELISINEANKAELMKLPKVGAATAQKIIDNRPYEQLDALADVDGISRDMYELWREKIQL